MKNSLDPNQTDYILMLVKSVEQGYCRFGNFRECFTYVKLCNFVYKKFSQKGEIALTFTDVDKSFQNREF